MFCTNCGKPTEGDSTLCSSCIAAMRAQEENKAPEVEIQNQPAPQANEATPIAETVYRYASEPAPSNQKLGLGPAIAATVISEVGAMLAYIFYFVALYAPVPGMLLSIFLAGPMFVVSLILGISSIKCAKSAVGRKPIATLILGIVSVVSAGFTALFIFLAFAMGCVMLGLTS